MKGMQSARPVVVRLMAVAFAIAGAAGGSGRAPLALRVWADPAAEIAYTPAAVARQRAAGERAARPPAAFRARASLARPQRSLAATSGRQRQGTLTWPAASTGREILAFKRSRLV
jgi:hypothetical protein